MLSTYPNIKKAIDYSNNALEKIRHEIRENIKPNSGVLILTVGSVARKESSSESDLDYYIVCKDDVLEAEIDRVKFEFEKALEKLGFRMPSNEGAFACHATQKEMLENIGGDEDNTDHLTRRILYLFESEWLFNEEMYDELFSQTIECYVQDEITQHALCRFLLNDLIRYYRTVCVDFEFKTVERRKSWGDRNIKLAFARKQMYFSGILVLAATVQHTCTEKRRLLLDLLKLSPLERIDKICGLKSEEAIKYYDMYLEKLSDSSFREMLKSTTIDRESHGEQFREIKNNGHHYTWVLQNLLENTFASSHPIHTAIKF